MAQTHSPDAQRVRVAERRLRQPVRARDPDQRHVDGRIGAHDIGAEDTAVGQRHRDAVGRLDDVVVRQHETVASITKPLPDPWRGESKSRGSGPSIGPSPRRE